MSELLSPLDDANRRLLEHVRPRDWKNPRGGSYDLVVIGGGTAGLVSVLGAAGLGARVALVERALLGGDCLNAGCVPSKALLRSARAVREVAAAGNVGVNVGPAVADFPAIMRRMRGLRARIAHNDSAKRLATAGVDVFFGSARFSGPREVAVDGARLRFRRAIVATGERPTAPAVPGLAKVPYLTNENVFWLTELPRRLLVIGAGAVGCELAQAFALFGSVVTVVDVADRPLPREDPDASQIVERRLQADGVRFELGVRLQHVQRSATGVSVEWMRGQTTGTVEADTVLAATGRAPNVEGLDLAAAGIRVGEAGIEVNERLQTSNPRIYAAGDVAAPWKFTHAADATARLVLRNALFFGRRRLGGLVIPWCTYTMPEVAHVGLTCAEASSSGAEAITIPFDDVDRAVVDDATDGFVRVYHNRGRMLGCTIVGAHADDLIAHAAHILRTGGRLSDLADTVCPYPTYAEALRKAGDVYRRTLLTPRLRRVIEGYFAALRRF